MRRLLIALVAIAIGGFAISAKQSEKLEQLYKKIDRVQVMPVGKGGPIIGITPTGSRQNSVGRAYVDAVLRAGGVPLVLVADTTAEYLTQVIGSLDGVLLTGGEDIEPGYFSEEPIKELGEVDTIRDVLELTLLYLAKNRNIPVFGICRGCQTINVGMGGSLYQDFPSQRGASVHHQRVLATGHRALHTVSISEDNILYKIIGKTQITVNSSHHQSVKDLGKGINVGAYSEDSIVESVDMYPNYRVLGVQWHPEGFNGKDESMNKLLEFFINEAKLYKTAKDIHSRVISVDTHTDAPLDFADGMQLGKRWSNRVNVPKMQEGLLDSQFFAAYVGSDRKVKENGKTKRVKKELNQASYDECHKTVLDLIDSTYAQVQRYGDVCGIALNRDDVVKLKAEGKKAIFIGVENAIGIGTDLDRVNELKLRGVKYITLSHTYDNQVCHSSSNTADAKKGLTKFGRKLVKEMNKQGILIDLSHTSEGTFWDVVKLSDKPVFCSHSGARALCNNDRNLTDEQLKALAENGGVVHAVAYAGFLKEDKQATIDDYIRHIDHMVKVAGIDHVGIGTDFDGGGGVPGFEADNDMVNVTMKLLEKGYSESDIEKLWGGNFFRVLGEVEGK